MTQDYDDMAVLDGQGERVGTIERTYLDDGGTARFVEVKIGSLLAQHRLVPLDGAETTGAGLRVPHARQAIQESPDASSADETLEGELLDAVRAYYARWQGSEAASAQADDQQVRSVPADRSVETSSPGPETARSSGQIRDLDDVIEVPIVEEELVKRPVVKEVLRIRKKSIATRETVGGEVRREDVEIERQGDVSGRHDVEV